MSKLQLKAHRGQLFFSSNSEELIIRLADQLEQIGFEYKRDKDIRLHQLRTYKIIAIYSGDTRAEYIDWTLGLDRHQDVSYDVNTDEQLNHALRVVDNLIDRDPTEASLIRLGNLNKVRHVFTGPKGVVEAFLALIQERFGFIHSPEFGDSHITTPVIMTGFNGREVIKKNIFKLEQTALVNFTRNQYVIYRLEQDWDMAVTAMQGLSILQGGTVSSEPPKEDSLGKFSVKYPTAKAVIETVKGGVVISKSGSVHLLNTGFLFGEKDSFLSLLKHRISENVGSEQSYNGARFTITHQSLLTFKAGIGTSEKQDVFEYSDIARLEAVINS